MTQREISPPWFGFLEGCIVMSWLLLLSGLMVDSDEMSVLIGFPILLFVSGWLMNVLNRSAGSTVVAAAGAIAIILGSLSFFIPFGTTRFLIVVPVIGFIFVSRFSRILSQDQTMEYMSRRYFLQESFVIPFLCLFCFQYGLKSSLVSPVLLVAGVAAYLFLRCFQLVLIQRTLRGKWQLQIWNTMLPVGFFVAALLILAAFPYILYVTAWIFVPIMDLLASFLGRFKRTPLESQEDNPPADEEQMAQMLEEMRQAASHPVHIPDWALILTIMLIAGAILVIFQKKKGIRRTISPTVPAVQIIRNKWSESRGLQYVQSDSPVRRIYQQMLQWFERQGKPIRIHETPREFAARLRQEQCLDSVQERDVEELSMNYERVRYGAAASSEDNELMIRKARQALERLKSKPDAGSGD
ncbi:hypothetical protein SD71_20325 [Cohnella kolymensis]|uniref:Protein-glutamine gamma-glutamyltransferase-like C-terminal domain-containing protein n=1 Tax=Cohnella kolymensis TaxID=1590652 RepID=A0ABR4ZZX7_9BACL|nr:DUF4129 domain-containing protein [Cohnella kolymensis]KIL34376.1 hypothetical protein SD71_20325 [Cohnella kolymensis]